MVCLSIFIFYYLRERKKESSFQAFCAVNLSFTTLLSLFSMIFFLNSFCMLSNAIFASILFTAITGGHCWKRRRSFLYFFGKLQHANVMLFLFLLIFWMPRLLFLLLFLSECLHLFMCFPSWFEKRPVLKYSQHLTFVFLFFCFA